MNAQSFQRFAALAAVLSFPVAMASFYTALLGVDFNMDVLSDPALGITMDARGAELWRWSMILDMLGYYLMIVPIVLVLAGWLRHRGADWVTFFVFCLLSYSLIGAMGASILASTAPPLINSWHSATEPQRAAIELVFTNQLNSVYSGLWNLLEELVAGVGWLGFGLLLKRERPAFGWVTIVLGLACLLDSLGSILGKKAISVPGLYVYLILAPLWACWLGVSLLRRPLATAGAEV